MFWAALKPRPSRPAATSRIRQTVTCPPIKTLRRKRRDRFPDTFDSSFRLEARSTFVDSNAGSKPNTIPVATETEQVYAQSRQSRDKFNARAGICYGKLARNQL